MKGFTYKSIFSVSLKRQAKKTKNRSCTRIFIIRKAFHKGIKSLFYYIFGLFYDFSRGYIKDVEGGLQVVLFASIRERTAPLDCQNFARFLPSLAGFKSFAHVGKVNRHSYISALRIGYVKVRAKLKKSRKMSDIRRLKLLVETVDFVRRLRRALPLLTRLESQTRKRNTQNPDDITAAP